MAESTESSGIQMLLIILNDIISRRDIPDGPVEFRLHSALREVKNINAINKGKAIIHIICSEYRGENRGPIFYRLLEKIIREYGADVNLPDRDGCSPLCLVIRKCLTPHTNEFEFETQLQLVRILIAAGANLKELFDGKTLLEWAIMTYNPYPIIDLLIKHGSYDAKTLNASLDLVLLDGMLSYKPAVWNTYNIVKIILKAGADPARITMNDPKTGEIVNKTPLHCAVEANFAAICKLLRKYGANPKEKGTCDSTPIQLAENMPEAVITNLQFKYQGPHIIDPTLFKPDLAMSTLEVLYE
jgi:ankyrin repeat protein